jgi:hypothetical protein
VTVDSCPAVCVRDGEKPGAALCVGPEVDVSKISPPCGWVWLWLSHTFQLFFFLTLVFFSIDEEVSVLFVERILKTISFVSSATSN